MKGVMVMRIRSEYIKTHHAKALDADVRREQMIRNVSEDAKKQFHRKPYQIGGKKQMNYPMEKRIEEVKKEQERTDKQFEKKHLEEFKERAGNFTDREKKIVLKTVSNKMLIEELSRRLIELTNAINKIRKDVKIE